MIPPQPSSQSSGSAAVPSGDRPPEAVDNPSSASQSPAAMQSGSVEFEVSTVKLMQGLVVVLLVLLSISTISQLAHFGWNYRTPFIASLTRFFFVDRERNVPTLFAGLILLLAAILCSLIGLIQYQLKQRSNHYWFGLFAIFLCIAVDEVAQLHERVNVPLRGWLKTEGALYFAWVIPAIGLVGLTALLYWKFWRSLPTKIAVPLATGAVLYVLGGLGLELIGGWYFDYYTHKNLVYSLIVTVEETLEMVGVLVMNSAFLAYLQSYLPALQIRFR